MLVLEDVLLGDSEERMGQAGQARRKSQTRLCYR